MASNRRPSSRKSIAYLPSPDADPTIGNKENLTVDGLGLAAASTENDLVAAKQKKNRSKSLGPGGLDTLKEGAGSRRKIAAALPKSILKPSIPLSPLREIPTRKSATQSKPASATASPTRNSPSPTKPRAGAASSLAIQRRPLTSPLKATTKEPETSQVRPNALEQDEASQQRHKQREEIQKQRDVRRKSMANRRVSFAPEATLHTFDNIIDMEDSTTSSASTNDTRRASQMPKGSPFRSSTRSNGDPPSTPSDQGDEATPERSPISRQELHQNKRRRRSSGIPPLNFNNPEDAVSSSPYSEASATVDDQTFADAAERAEGGAEGSPSGSVSMAGSSPLLADVKSPAKSPTLRPGAPQPNDDVFDDDEDGGMTMEMAGDEVTAAFQPWMQKMLKGQQGPKHSPNVDQENVNPFSSISAGAPMRTAAGPSPSVFDNGEMSMDITRAVGGIVRSPGRAAEITKSAQSSPNRRGSIANRRRSSGSSSTFEDGTMDLTTAIGGIQSVAGGDLDESQIDRNEDLSMEFTSVFGGIQNKTKRLSLASFPASGEKRLPVVAEESRNNIGDDGDVEMTTAITDIAQGQKSEQPAQDEDEMEMTRAVGSILPHEKQSNSAESQLATEMMAARSPSSSRATSKQRLDTLISATGSPALTASRGRGRPRKSEAVPALGTPLKGPTTPQKQLTPLPTRPVTPGKTPPANIAMRHPSPIRLFRSEIKQAKASPLARRASLFTQDLQNGNHTPNIRLAPTAQVKRRVSGVGFDKEGLGSPKVAALLDRRVSIGEQADLFAPSTYEARGVRFQDPRALEVEIAEEYEEDGRRESEQFVSQNEADGEDEERDATTTLRDAIVSMTPKKEKLKGRKSLAVGAAKGLLGKRPAELDEDDDEASPDRLKGREASPMKRIRLQAPPSASETTRRNGFSRASLGPTTGSRRPTTPTNASPLKQLGTTPDHKGHFRDFQVLSSVQNPLPVMGQSDSGQFQDPQVAGDSADKISLQDFLNLTSIRFMELNTTKRRHTVAPRAGMDLSGVTDSEGEEPSKRFGDAVVAGACTLPMLELYQHSCRELKKYISEGRKIVREIEASTSEDNPQLFQEYISAVPAERAIMDNQFKNMKTHARHLSKGMWYEWRMKLLEGLREVLIGEAEGLKTDSTLFEEQERSLDSALPPLIEQHEQLEQEVAELQQRATDIADCDQEELASARHDVRSKDEAVRAKRERLEQMKAQAAELDKNLEDGQDAKDEYQQAIKEAQRVREEYRGWSAVEVNRLKEQVDSLEAEHDWAITGASGTRLTMVFKGQLELFFETTAFLPAVSSTDTASIGNSPISLSYTADSREHKPLPLTTEKRFFLQLIRAHLQSIVQCRTQVNDLLTFVSASWTQALALSEEISRLNLEGITHCSILSDERLLVTTMMLLATVKTKVSLSFEVGVAANEMEVDMRLKTRAEVAYGEQYREDKMRDFLKARIGEGVSLGQASWADAVRELKGRLIARGKKQ